MSEQNGLNPAERELEQALKALAPAAAQIDPVGAAFEAGRRSVRRQLQLWRAAAAAALLIGVGSWLNPFGPGTGTQSLEVAIHSPPALAEPLAAQSVVMLQAAVRELGLAGLPTTPLPNVASHRADDLL